MTIQLPDIAVEYEPTDPDGRINAVDAAIDALDKHLRLAVRLFESRSEDFYGIAAQAHEQMRQVLRHANQVEDEFYRRDFRRRLHRAQAVISYLQEYGPYVEGSGVLRSRNPREKIQSVTPGGLPGLGKRR